MKFPKGQQAVPARDLQREGRPGDTVLIPASEIDSGKGVVLGWRGPDMEPEEFAKKYLRPLKPEECGNLLVDMAGYWECFGGGYTVIGDLGGYKYLSLAQIAKYEKLARSWGVSEVARSSRGFLTAYKRAGGNPGRLSEAWQAKRDGFVRRHMAQVKMNREPLFESGMPTRRHLALVMWAYSPRAGSL